ncbi:autotransporter domain-containing protein [Pistricoccus aurantiacus]|uniref:Autotransporter domain-containing protein n=1 Tax=Pistricoccus aurantiacus TaxID=1883414 RepID=A0A5B8T102_9GAMM|nr:autotransporter domain-containing SGNH/GDSL hydrolase family protein [Pistricoccus aurantiacus]QEA40733.1 autotransporter domain-containing protein [Pistricoccus aurantiacus]
MRSNPGSSPMTFSTASRQEKRLALSALVGLAMLPGGALAYSQLVVFGDSLSDSGQFPDAEAIAQGGLGSLRFTNRLGPSFEAPSPYGEVSTQRLSKALGLGPLLPSTSFLRDQAGLPDGTNYATGGYTTDDILASIIQPDGSVVPVPDTNLNLRTRDGYLVEVGSADPNALYYVNGGGNDFLDGLIASPQAAIASADTLANGVDALVEAGAKTLIVSNVPDVGATPAGLASGQRENFAALGEVYNQALGARLAPYDGQVEIIRLNVPALFEEVVAAPEDFGLATDVPLTDVCFTDSACDVTPYGLRSANPDPDKLLFNDLVHPTTAGQEILADYAYALVSAPRTLALAGELSLDALNAQTRAVNMELRPGWQSDALRVFAQGDYQGDQNNLFDEDGRPDSNQAGLGVGLVAPLGWGWVGASVSQRHAELDDPADFELDGQAYSLFARQHLGRVGVQASVTRGDFDLDLKRRVALGQGSRTLKGEPNAKGWAAELRLDYRLSATDSVWYTAPFIAYRHIESDIDGYREDGSPANALIVDDQDIKERQLELGLMADRALQSGIGWYGEFAWGEYLEDERDGVEVRLASLPTNSWSGESIDREHDHYIRADAGLRLGWGNASVQLGAGAQGWNDLTPHVQLGASYRF